MKKLTRAILIVASFLFSTLPIQAALVAINGKDTIFIEGTIEQGDSVKFLNAVELLQGRYSNLVINSAGGAFVDALAISVFNAIKGGVTTETRTLCNSACAFIILSGSRMKFDGVEVLMHMPYELIDGKLVTTEEVVAETAWLLGFLKIPLKMTIDLLPYRDGKPGDSLVLDDVYMEELFYQKSSDGYYNMED